MIFLFLLGSKTGKFTKVVVSDCDTTKNECILKRNSSVSITIDFSLGKNKIFCFNKNMKNENLFIIYSWRCHIDQNCCSR